MATTTLTPEQIAEAKRFIAAEAKEKSDSSGRAIRAELHAAAQRVIKQVLACPGVASAKEDSSGFYFNATGIDIHFTDEPKYKFASRGSYLVLKMDGYVPGGNIRVTAKVKRGYKSGVRTFKSVKSAVKALHAFEQDIWESVAAWTAAEKAKQAAQAAK